MLPTAKVAKTGGCLSRTWCQLAPFRPVSPQASLVYRVGGQDVVPHHHRRGDIPDSFCPKPRPWEACGWIRCWWSIHALVSPDLQWKGWKQQLWDTTSGRLLAQKRIFRKRTDTYILLLQDFGGIKFLRMFGNVWNAKLVELVLSIVKVWTRSTAIPAQIPKLQTSQWRHPHSRAPRHLEVWSKTAPSQSSTAAFSERNKGFPL